MVDYSSVTGDSTTQFVYDGDGNRVKKTEGGETILYINKYYEKNLTTDEVTTSYYLGGRLIAQRQGTDLQYVHQDHLTGTAMMSDSSGAALGTIKYFPFGATRSGSVPTDKKFTGQRLDNSGLYYYNARYYDPNIGRFISGDSIVPDPYNPQALNRYAYVLNNPLKYDDPSGNFVALAVIGVGAAVGAVVGAVAYGVHVAVTGHAFTPGEFGGFVLGGAVAGALAPVCVAMIPVGLGATAATIAGIAATGLVAGTASYIAQEGFESAVNYATGYPDQGSPSWQGWGFSVIGAASGQGIVKGIGALRGEVLSNTAKSAVVAGTTSSTFSEFFGWLFTTPPSTSPTALLPASSTPPPFAPPVTLTGWAYIGWGIAAMPNSASQASAAARASAPYAAGSGWSEATPSGLAVWAGWSASMGLSSVGNTSAYGWNTASFAWGASYTWGMSSYGPTSQQW